MWAILPDNGSLPKQNKKFVMLSEWKLCAFGFSMFFMIPVLFIYYSYIRWLLFESQRDCPCCSSHFWFSVYFLLWSWSEFGASKSETKYFHHPANSPDELQVIHLYIHACFMLSHLHWSVQHYILSFQKSNRNGNNTKDFWHSTLQKFQMEIEQFHSDFCRLFCECEWQNIC